MRQIYKADFVGKIEIEDLEPQGYKVCLYLDNDQYPLTILADLPDDEFLPFIKEEIRSRKLNKTKYFKLTKIYPECNYFCK